MIGHKVAPNPVASVKQIVTDLPAGLVGDAQAAATCPLVDITNHLGNQADCPAASRVGKLALIEPSGVETELTIFNVLPEEGYAAEFAVYLPSLSRAEVLYAKLVGSGSKAHVRVVSAPQDSAVKDAGISLTFFGDPAVLNGSLTSPAAFFTNPSNCAASGFTSTIYVDSWQSPGRVESDGEPDLADPNWKKATSESPPVSGCDALSFHPTLSLAPEAEHSGADEPSGYGATLRIPENEDVNSLGTPPLKTAVITLPAGVVISPAGANGLAGCQESGPEGIEVDSNQPGHCPAASAVGQVEVVTPLLKEVLKGSVFVAEPGCGSEGQPACSEEAAETGGVFALYLEVGSRTSGVHLKLKGKVEVGGSGGHNDLAPGQVRTTFAETPQDPFSELKLSFNAGPRAPLANPQTCGSFGSVAQFEPWSHEPSAQRTRGTPDIDSSAGFFTISGCED